MTITLDRGTVAAVKLFFDARYIRLPFHDGVSRYSTELGNALAAITPVTFLISDMRQLTRLPKDAKYIKIHKPTSAKEPFTALILNKYKPDVVFSPMMTMGTLGRRFKLILTSHDMIYYHYPTTPQNVGLALKIGWRLYHATYIPERLSLNQADLVVTVSETVKKQFQEAKLTKRPIVVVYNAPQDLKQFVKVVKSGVPKNIVYMGAFISYKNVETLIKGMEWLPGRTLHLLSGIRPQRKKELEALIPTGADVIFHNGVSDEEYAKLLANDAVLTKATLDEGFGLSLAEAQELGTPAVVSDIPVLREVGGNAALYFNPMNPQEFANQVKKLDDKELRDRIIKAGKVQAAKFTWQHSAQALLKAINSLI